MHPSSLLPSLSAVSPALCAYVTTGNKVKTQSLLISSPHPNSAEQLHPTALVLIDRSGRRRLVLPFGWGAGRHVLDGAGGWIVRERFAEILLKAVGNLEREWMEEMEERHHGTMAS